MSMDDVIAVVQRKPRAALQSASLSKNVEVFSVVRIWSNSKLSNRSHICSHSNTEQLHSQITSPPARSCQWTMFLPTLLLEMTVRTKHSLLVEKLRERKLRNHMMGRKVSLTFGILSDLLKETFCAQPSTHTAALAV